MTNLPTPCAAARIAAFLSGHLCWSACWDKKDGVWRVFQDDPDSDLYAESRDAAAVIRYMTSHSLGAARVRSVGGFPAGVAVCGAFEDVRGRPDLRLGRLQDRAAT